MPIPLAAVGGGAAAAFGALGFAAGRTTAGPGGGAAQPGKPVPADGFRNAPWSPQPVRGTQSGDVVSGAVSLSPMEADLGKIGCAGVKLDTAKWIALLEKLVAQSKYLQNNPKLGITPKEKLAADIVLKELDPYTTKNGGPLTVEVFEYVPGRPNVKIVYGGAGNGRTLGFVGSHLDVVPANPEDWNVDPFKLTVDGDKLYGRGTTDCLGHVALITRMLCDFAEKKVVLKRKLVVVFIAAEEGGEKGVGVDMLVKHGQLDELKKGPVYWIDSADSQPCCGTGGALQWTLKATGRLFHSGLPHKGINAIELLSEALAEVQKRFYTDFPRHADEDRWNFTTGSTMKPTQMEVAKGSLNQIPPWASASGDIRLGPFYDVGVTMKRIEEYVSDINARIDRLPTRGSWSKYVLDPSSGSEILRGKLELTWAGTATEAELYEGIACSLDSAGHKALVQATREVKGEAKPYSISGSLPLVRQMQRAGYDLQIDGFGLMSTYHANNEYCLATNFEDAYQIFLRIISLLDTHDG